ncbi:MAG: diguanylate cyclase [Bacillota bacterium]|nr:diguanylate cyclase [Bacillota bacterium]
MLLNASDHVEMLASLPVIIYISDLETHEILFLSRYAEDAFGLQVGQICYEAIHGHSEPCGFCNNQALIDEQGNPTGVLLSEVYNAHLGRWFEAHTMATVWEGKLARLEVAIEITDRVQLQNIISPREEYYGAMLDSIGDGVIVTDIDGKITWMNPKAQELTGWSKQSALGEPFEEVFVIINSNTREPHSRVISEVLETEDGVTLANHTSLISKNGHEYHIADSAAPIKDRRGNILGVIVVFQDVSEDYRKREALRASEERFRTLFEHSINGIALHEMIYDDGGNPIDYRFLAVNKSFENITGLTAYDIIGRTVSEFLPKIEKYWIERYAKVAQEGTQVEFEQYNQDLKKHFIVRAYSPGIGLFVTVFHDVTKQKILERELNELAFRDPLTGLYNRRYLERELNRLGEIPDQHPLSILIGDVNGLKIINDSMGHAEGDFVLKAVADAIEKVSRPEDVGARWGGDEFVLLLPKTNSKEGQEIAKKLEEISASAAKNSISPSISVGVATKHSVDDSSTDVLRNAENRMYKEKMTNAKSSRNTLVASLQRTLAEKSYETEAHARHLEELALAVGREVGLRESELSQLSLVAILHDIGKVAIPEQILEKPGPLTNKEWKVMREHAAIGYRILVSSPDLIEVAEGVLSHHERWDGRGYPRGLKGEEIPILARIISIVDAYDAMTTDRPYRRKMIPQDAIREIEMCAGTQFDPHLARLFVDMMNQKIVEV